MGPKKNMLKVKMISTLQSWIHQQPLIGSSSKYKLKFRGLNQNQKYLKWRWSLMEDTLKVLKVEYISNHWSNLPQIVNLISGDQFWIKNAWNDDDLQWKTTSKYQSCISQQPLIGSSWNFKLKLREPNKKYKMKTPLKLGRDQSINWKL